MVKSWHILRHFTTYTETETIARPAGLGEQMAKHIANNDIVNQLVLDLPFLCYNRVLTFPILPDRQPELTIAAIQFA